MPLLCTYDYWTGMNFDHATPFCGISPRSTLFRWLNWEAMDTNLNSLGEIRNYIYLKEGQNTFILYTLGKILGLRIR